MARGWCLFTSNFPGAAEKGVAANGGPHNWGRISGKSAASVQKELKASQEFEIKYYNFFKIKGHPRDATVGNYFNPLGPIAVMEPTGIGKSGRLGDTFRKTYETIEVMRKGWELILMTTTKQDEAYRLVSGDVGRFFKNYTEALKNANVQLLKLRKMLNGWYKDGAERRLFAALDKGLDTASTAYQKLYPSLVSGAPTTRTAPAAPPAVSAQANGQWSRSLKNTNEYGNQFTFGQKVTTSQDNILIEAISSNNNKGFGEGVTTDVATFTRRDVARVEITSNSLCMNCRVSIQLLSPAVKRRTVSSFQGSSSEDNSQQQWVSANFATPADAEAFAAFIRSGGPSTPVSAAKAQVPASPDGILLTAEQMARQIKDTLAMVRADEVSYVCNGSTYDNESLRLQYCASQAK